MRINNVDQNLIKMNYLPQKNQDVLAAIILLLAESTFGLTLLLFPTVIPLIIIIILYIYIYIYTVDLSDSLVVAGILNQFKVKVKCQHQLGLARLVFLILTLRHSEVSCSLFLVLSLSG